MFCSNCGKSLKSEHTACPYCGMPVGESRFDSNRGYTGAQSKLRPGQAVRVNNTYGNHYSTAFNVDSDKNKAELPSDQDSAYRAVEGATVTGYGEGDDREPLFDSQDPWRREAEVEDEAQAVEEAESAPASEKRSFRSLFLRGEGEQSEPEEEQAQDDDDEDYELTEEELSSISLSGETTATPGAGISDDVRRFMTGLREEYDRRTREEERKAAKKKSKKQADEKKDKDVAFDAYGEDDKSKRKKKRKVYEDFETDDEDDGELEEVPEETEDDTDDAVEEVEAPEESEQPAKPKKPGRKQLRVAREFFKRSKPEEDFDDYDPEDEEDEDEEDEDNEYLDDYDDDTIDDELRRSNRLKILGYILAGLLGVLVIAGVIWGITGLKNRQSNVAPVEDVTLSLWNEGTELMQYRVSNDYIEQKLGMYNPNDQSGSWALFSASFTKDLDDLNNLLPSTGDRQMNDQLFVDALKAIQTNINNCLSNDWMAMMDTSKTQTQKASESASRWQVVRNQVNQLFRATSRGELDAVKKSEVVAYTVEKEEETQSETQTTVTYTSLQKGSSGDDVIRLQTRLTNLGYLNDTIDGKYGNKTVTAVQLFQQQVGLNATGIADNDTQTRLYADDAPMYNK